MSLERPRGRRLVQVEDKSAQKMCKKKTLGEQLDGRFSTKSGKNEPG